MLAQKNRMGKKPVVTFAEWGNVTRALKVFLKSVHVDYITCGHTTNKHLELGKRYAPESICFAFKPFLGGLIESVQKGANTVLWIGSHGPCRLRYYPMLQEIILRRLGYEVDFYAVSQLSIFRDLKKLFGLSYPRLFERFVLAYRVLRLVEKAEVQSYRFRPREKNKGETDKALAWALNQIDAIEKHGDIERTQKKISHAFNAIPTEKRKVPVILILGEIYLIHDPFANHDLLRKLGALGYEVKVTFTGSESLSHMFFDRFHQWKISRLTKNYLGVHVGGHGRPGVMELVDHIQKKEIEGAIHIAPFGCMPEVTANPIMQKIAQKHRLPYLFLTFDVQTSDTGLQTRLEAFSDLIRWKQEQAVV